ncbi:hypothetical protein NCAS_0G00820 [Naumovozyma castellii]|uniref:Uncharacterized protein n=1 Tax=Naumovozyma castellii TaxID=27288 RepID=G0VHT5_NAUCA|nr:hypothetical protein NCAS_0G00820 [Naumovozyma castellii CBS 4309]CCC70969.1 hypothetical protein NCAS_0G00820 [Naumovozyma castellii CBS 4309]
MLKNTDIEKNTDPVEDPSKQKEKKISKTARCWKCFFSIWITRSFYAAIKSYWGLDGPIPMYIFYTMMAFEFIFLILVVVFAVIERKIIPKRCVDEDCILCPMLKKNPYLMVRRLHIVMTLFAILTPIIYFTVKHYIKAHPDDFLDFVDIYNWKYWVAFTVMMMDYISFISIFSGLVNIYITHPYKEFVQLKKELDLQPDLEKGLLDNSSLNK